MAFEDFDDILQDPRKTKVTEKEKREGVFDTGQDEDIWRTDIDPDTVFIAGTDEEIHDTMPEEPGEELEADTEELDLSDILVDDDEDEDDDCDDQCEGNCPGC